MFYKIGLLKISENLQENTCARVFFLEKVAHRQVCNLIKKRLQHRCFTVNFAKLLKALYRIPPVRASNFNSTFLTLYRVRRVSTFSQHYFFLIFLIYFMFHIEASNISVWFYTKCSVKQALFLTS